MIPRQAKIKKVLISEPDQKVYYLVAQICEGWDRPIITIHLSIEDANLKIEKEKMDDEIWNERHPNNTPNYKYRIYEVLLDI